MADLLVLWSFTIEDALGVSATHDVFVKCADTTTLATINTQNGLYQALLDAVTGGIIRKATCRVFMDLAVGDKSVATEGAEVERTMLGNFAQSGSLYKYGVDVPALESTLIVGGKVDLTNSDFTAWRDWFFTAHSGIQAVSKFLAVLTSLIDVLITFRKHRKAEDRRSIETGS